MADEEDQVVCADCADAAAGCQYGGTCELEDDVSVGFLSN